MPAASWQSVAANSRNLGGDPVVDKPAGTVAGDLLIAVGVSSSAAITPPDGSWVEHASSLGSQYPLWTKVAGSSEPASYTFATGGTSASIVVIVRVAGQAVVSPIDDADGIAGTGNLVIPSVTSGGSNRLLMQIVAKVNGTSFTPPGSATERFDANYSVSNHTAAGGDEVVGSGATGSRTWTPASGSGQGVGYMLAIAPSAAVLETTGSASGTATADAAAAKVLPASGSADGAANTSGSAGATAGTTGSAAGTATGSAPGGSTANTTGAADGTAQVTGAAAAVALATGSAAGTSTADGSTGKVLGTTGTAAVGSGSPTIRPVFVFDD